MIPLLYRLSIITAFLCCTQSAQACTPLLLKPRWENERVVQADNCAFTGAGRYDFVTGGESQNLGQGRVMQFTNHSDGSDTLIITDCNTGEQIQTHGWYELGPNDTMCTSQIQAAHFLTPAGRLDPRAGQTITELAKILTGNGFVVNYDDFYNTDKANRYDHPDLFCGCKLFYPNTKGAMQ